MISFRKLSIAGLCGLATVGLAANGASAAEKQHPKNQGAVVSSKCAKLTDPGKKDECVRAARKSAGHGSIKSFQQTTPKDKGKS